MKRLTTELRNQIRRDRREYLFSITSKKLDRRNKWMGIRRLKKGTTTIHTHSEQAQGPGSRQEKKQKKQRNTLPKNMG